MTKPSAEYLRFVQSMKLSYADWHDGVGYDLDAVRAMSPIEQTDVVRLMGDQTQGWRAIEVLRTIASPDARRALAHSLSSSLTDTRLHAADALHALGELPDIAPIIADSLGKATLLDGMTTALRLAARFPHDEVLRALLAETRRRPEVAVQYAALLCYLTGHAESEFDWAMRPFFIRFGEHAAPEDRAAAYDELRKLTGM
jgi:hypothetical protein